MLLVLLLLLGNLFGLEVVGSFKEGAFIPKKYTCEGENLSPRIAWKNFPRETKSFLVLVEDPDAPLGTFTHWIVYNIPRTKTFLREGFPKRERVGPIRQGLNDFGRVGYWGPCPPRGDKPHRYYFKVFALDLEKLNFKGIPKREDVLRAIKGHVIDRGFLMGRFKR